MNQKNNSQQWHSSNKELIADQMAAIMASGMASRVTAGAKSYSDAIDILVENAAEKIAALDRKCGVSVPDLSSTEIMSEEEMRAIARKPKLSI